MFRFVVRHLRWLARVPLAPQLFDALLLAWTAKRNILPAALREPFHMLHHAEVDRSENVVRPPVEIRGRPDVQ